MREFDNGNKIAKFSVVDNEYFYTKDTERKGQFYTVEVTGKAADIVVDRLQRGDRVAVHGQLVQRDYSDRTFLDVRQARVTFLEERRDKGGEDLPF